MALTFRSDPPPGMDRIQWMESRLLEKYKDILIVLGYLRTVNPVMRDPVLSIVKQLKAKIEPKKANPTRENFELQLMAKQAQ